MSGTARQSGGNHIHRRELQIPFDFAQGRLSDASNEQTIPPVSFLIEWHGRLRFAVSHISRKTREIWGTLDYLLGESQTVAVHFTLNLLSASQLLGMIREGALPFASDAG